MSVKLEQIAGGDPYLYFIGGHGDHNRWGLTGLERKSDGKVYVVGRSSMLGPAAIRQYDADGNYLMEWGELGDGPGQFDLVHGVAIDRDHRVYVADRSNNRVQVFTEEGDFIEELFIASTHEYLLVFLNNGSGTFTDSGQTFASSTTVNTESPPAASPPLPSSTIGTAVHPVA